MENDRDSTTASQSVHNAYWQAQYEFYHRIISEEVDHLRVQSGLETLRVTLYPVQKKKRFSDPDFIGKALLLGRTYYATVHNSFDDANRRIIKFKLSPKP